MQNHDQFARCLVEKLLVHALGRELEKLEKETVKSREMLAANRRVFPPVVGLSFLLGIFLGVALPRLRRKKHVEKKP